MNREHFTDEDKYDAKSRHLQSQLALLAQVEGQSEGEPDTSALILAGGLSVIEAGVAFFLLLPGGLLMATIGAFFPVFLLWAMANFQADRVDLPNKLDELAEIYEQEQR
ncbi:MAG: hypothetical protein KME17_08470 [Cyanosarcina radialis HA8281-LM2]|jgi:hypothetical protein|nr:hypothetical protein [Cyanosarcina radialis HA8281-LM2]